MACYHPVTAWYSAEKNSSGKRGLVFAPSGGFGLPFEISCGQCLGCRLERARQWAIRCMHEAQYHEATSFLTLTYAPEHLPSPPSVDVRDLQLFFKRLRRGRSHRLRYFACGEYGEQFDRPHYHVILFGEDFLLDRTFHSRTPFGDTYTSPTLDAAWGLGQCTIGSLTLESAGYVARYSMKKITGPMAEDHYKRIDYATGELVDLRPEFIVMSRRPGIAADFFDDFKSDLYPDDFVIQKGKKLRVPRFYDRKLPEHELAELKLARRKRGRKHAANNTPARLRVRETVTAARIANLKRGLSK